VCLCLCLRVFVRRGCSLAPLRRVGEASAPPPPLKRAPEGMSSARSRAALSALVARSGVVRGRGPAAPGRAGSAGSAGPPGDAGNSGSAGSSGAVSALTAADAVAVAAVGGGGALTAAGRAAAGIAVHDDFLSVDTQAEVLLQMERARWSFTGGRPPNSFWHMDGLEAEPFFREHLFGLICARLGRRFEVQRIYANGQTALQQGAPHVDDGDLTFLYYPNPRWRAAWNGSLHFLSGGALDAVVPYRPNRAVVFPSSLVHYADAPSKSFPGLRVSLAYKLLTKL